MTDQIIRNDRGEPIFAVVSWERYRALAGDDAAEELAEIAWAEAVAAARDSNEETFPVELVDRLIAGDHPIKVFREYRGMTQAQLADQIGSNRLYVSQIESGNRRGSLDVLRRIANALGVTIDDLDQPSSQ